MFLCRDAQWRKTLPVRFIRGHQFYGWPSPRLYSTLGLLNGYLIRCWALAFHLAAIKMLAIFPMVISGRVLYSGTCVCVLVAGQLVAAAGCPGTAAAAATDCPALLCS